MPCGFYKYPDWGHGRIENGKCWTVDVEHLDWFKNKDNWKDLARIGTRIVGGV